jgi:hydroxymethylpyrimidine/phosphomethylpyrimidine kinase
VTALTALTVAGTDSGGGAGVAADLKTFTAHDLWGLCAVTAVTAQNTVGVQAIHVVPPEVVAAQIESVAGDIGVAVTKTGMLATAATVATVAAAVARLGLTPLVVDPVAISSTGATLVEPAGMQALRLELLPLATVVTPNLAEAAALAGLDEVSDAGMMVTAARRILDLGCAAVVVTGGHLEGPLMRDLLLEAGGRPVWFEGPRHPSRHTHGTGCVFSAALAARLARQEPLERAVSGAKEFVASAVARALGLGAGTGPVNPASCASGPSPP